MKKYKNIILIITSLLFLACSNKGNTQNITATNLNERFSIYQDTIIVNIRGEMTHALKYRDKFYILFKEQQLACEIYGGYEKRRLYIFSNGQLEKILDCPQNMETVYLDFYVNNDSIILKPYMDKQCYYLDLSNYKWVEIDNADDLIFEDDKFWIYSKDFGEWGGKTWFKDKKTEQEYVLEATTPLVNKIGTNYFLTNSFIVLKIENPKLLNKCYSDITYENIELSGKSYSWYGKPIGYEVIYKDTTVDEFDYSFKSHIVSSFVLKNELLHVYKTKEAVFIAKIENNSIKTIKKIAGNIKLYDWYYSYRCKNLNGNNELLKFNTNNKRKFGLIEITENKVFIHYFINNAELEPKIIGYKKANDIFVKRLNFILNNFSNLKFKEIEREEQAWGSFDITPNHKISIGNNWNPNNYIINTNRSYLIKESSVFSNSVMYYGTKENDLARTVSIDWEYDGKNSSRKLFDNKSHFLINYITKNIGKQIKYSDKKDSLKVTWETASGIIINLSYNRKYYGIRLVIYEKQK
jgi:hypothetical protein